MAQKYNQKFGADYDKTFCPIVTLRLLLAMSVQQGLESGVTTAFLNGTLEEEVYIRQPKGFGVQAQEEPVWLEAIFKVLEYDTGCSTETNGFYTVNCRSLHPHLRYRRRSFSH